MASGIYIATSGAVAQGKALDVVSNNVANASTNGYKAQRVGFASALTAARSPDSSYVGVARVSSDQASGSLRQTGNPLDLAISGKGYFGLETKQGVRYTRAGNFRLDANNRLVTAAGVPVRAKGGGELTFPPNASKITVSKEGVISADGNEVGTIEVANFEANRLRRQGGNMYSATGAASTEPGGAVVSGSLELSNVNVVAGVVDLVRVSRSFEALSKVIQTYQAIESRTARSLGTPK